MCFQVSAATKTAKKNKKEDTRQTETSGKGEKKVEEKEEDDEEIPQLVPIATPSKKPKLQVSAIHRCLISLSNLFFKVTLGETKPKVLMLVKCKPSMILFYL